MVTGEDGWHAREGDSQLCPSMCVLVSVVKIPIPNTDIKNALSKTVLLFFVLKKLPQNLELNSERRYEITAWGRRE